MNLMYSEIRIFHVVLVYDGQSDTEFIYTLSIDRIYYPTNFLAKYVI